MSHKKRRIYFVIFWVLLISSFIFFATILILMANGYHINKSNFTLEKTGMIVINGNLKDVTVTLNGKDKVVSLPTKFTKLFPGRYEVGISKDGYNSWDDSISLEGGQAVILNNVILYLTNPDIIDQGADEKAVNRVKASYDTQKKQINLIGNEIWYNNKFITRFSQPILSAIFDTNNKHFYVQIGKEIRVLDEDGGNNSLISKLETDSPVVMSVNNNELSIIDNNKVKIIVLW